MTLIGLLVAIIVVLVALWLTTLVPIDPRVRLILQVVIVLVFVMWLLTGTGIFAGRIDAAIARSRPLRSGSALARVGLPSHSRFAVEGSCKSC